MSGFMWLNDTVGYSIGGASVSDEGTIQLAGDLGGVSSIPKVLKINGTTIPAGGSLTTGQTLLVSGSGALSYGALDLSNTSAITGTLPVANLPDASTSAKGIVKLASDLGGTALLPSVLKINGTSITSSPSANQVIVASSSSASSWAQIVDANISASAAIAGTKLAYSDASSPTLGSTTIQGAVDAIKTQAVATSIQRLTQNITTSNLQDAGATASASFNIGSVLPANSRVLGVEVQVTQILAGGLLVVAVVTVKGGADTAGSLLASSTLLTTGYYGGVGTNPYLTRGGQQLTATVTLTGALFNALSSGAFTINVFYAIIS